MPDSRSFAIAGAPRKAAVIARMKLNMNAARIRICDTPIRISSLVVPSPRASPAGARAPAREADTDDGEREEDPQDPPAGRLADREPRDRSRRGCRAIATPGEQCQEALLERASSGVDLVDAPAGDHDRFDQVRHARGIERLDRQPVAVARIGPNVPAGRPPARRGRWPARERPGRRGRRRAGPPPPRRDRRSRRGRRPARPRSGDASSAAPWCRVTGRRG